MTSALAGLPVGAGPDLDRTVVAGSAADQEATHQTATDFGRPSMLVWRPLLDAEGTR